MDMALLIARLIVGLGFAAHGAQKLFGWFRGPGLSETAVFFEGLGFSPGRVFATAAGVSELTGGMLIATGACGAAGPALVIASMVVAILIVHLDNGFFAESNGFELPLVYIAVALCLAMAGPGMYSLDWLAGASYFSRPAVAWSLVTLAVAGGLINVAFRRKPFTLSTVQPAIVRTVHSSVRA